MTTKLPHIVFKYATELDSQEIIDFWKRNDITVTPSDTAEQIACAARQHPQLFIIGCGPEDEIVGTVWGSFDGRRGYVAHLAVDHPYRNRGLGSLLMDRVEHEFRKLKCYKVHLFVEEDNASVGELYRRRGYSERTDLTIYSKTLR